MLFGGITNKTRTEAEDWLTGKVKELRLEQPREIYHKGDEFKGILYAKLSSPSAVECCIKAFAQDKTQSNLDGMWCNKDLPIHERIPIFVLLGLRWQLIQWGYSKQEVKVSDENLLLTVNKVPMVKAGVLDDKLQLTWEEDFGKWDTLQNSDELISLIAAAEKN